MDERTTVLFVLPPGGVTPHFVEHLGTAFLRTVLARAGIASAQYLPAANPSLAGFARVLRERRPAVVGFTAYESNLRLCRAMARTARETLPDAVIAAGGPNATFTPEETLELVGADLCLRGAGEGTIAGIVRAIVGAPSPRRRLADLLGSFPNVVVRTEDGPWRSREGDLSSFPAEHFAALDDIPSPYQDGVLETADVGVLTARGCNQHCTYCSFAAISGRRVHFHSVERVLEDLAALERLAGRVGLRRPSISILDDAFTLAPHRAREICEGILARGLEMPFDCETRADRVDADLLRLMRRAGFAHVSFGLESAVPRVLRAMGKVQDPETGSDPAFEAERAFLDRFRRAVAWAKDAGIAPRVSVIGGFPGETADDFRATLSFVASLGVESYAHNVLSALPGTPLYRDRARLGIRAFRERVGGSWRTRHAYDVDSVPPLPSSTAHVALWDEANELVDAICGRPRPERAAEAAWAAVIHADRPTAAIAAWLAKVLAVSGAVVVVPDVEADEEPWLRALADEAVPWGTFAILAPAGGGRALRAVGTLGPHRFEILPAWPDPGGAVEVERSGACGVPLWFAGDSDVPPPVAGAGPFAAAPQVVDGCRWWSQWRRCRAPRVLHARADGTVSACWRGPALGRVGDGWARLAERAVALGAGRGVAGDRCPIECGAPDPAAAAAAEAWDVAARTSWLLRKEAVA